MRTVAILIGFRRVVSRKVGAPLRPASKVVMLDVDPGVYDVDINFDGWIVVKMKRFRLLDILKRIGRIGGEG